MPGGEHTVDTAGVEVFESDRGRGDLEVREPGQVRVRASSRAGFSSGAGGTATLPQSSTMVPARPVLPVSATGRKA